MTERMEVVQESATTINAHLAADAPPLVTIGMPVLNGAETIKASLQSLLSQTYQNLKIVVCDNASTDETATIVKSMAAQDARLQLKHFEERGDFLTSFQRAASAAAGEYFMFAPCDDRWAPDFIASAVKQMQVSPNASVCCGRIELLEDGKSIGPSGGIQPIQGPASHRWREALLHTGDASRIYGLLRVSVLPGLFPETAPEGWDHYVAAKLALRGETIVIETLAMLRDRTSDEAYLAYIHQQEPTFWKQVFYLRHVRRLFLEDPEFDTGSLGAQMSLLGYILMHTYLPLKTRPKLYSRFRRLGRWLARTALSIPF